MAVGTETDGTLIERSCRGRPDAFVAVVRRHEVAVHAFLARRAGPQAAADLLGEVWLRAFACRGGYDPARADARPWLYGIAIRQIGRHRRAESRARRALARIPAETVTGDFGERADERVTAQQLRPCLAAVLSGLSRQDRELLLLIAWAGLTCEESARALGVPAGTVRSRLHRIRAKTRQALGGANPVFATQEGAGHG